MTGEAPEFVRAWPTHLDAPVRQSETTTSVNPRGATYFVLDQTASYRVEYGTAYIYVNAKRFGKQVRQFQAKQVVAISGKLRPTPAPTDEDRRTFDHLVAEWHKQRGSTSLTIEMVMTPAYQQIIGMGEKVLPLILRRLETEASDPDHWDWALTAITRVNTSVVPERDMGDTRKIAQAWLRWSRRRNG